MKKINRKKILKLSGFGILAFMISCTGIPLVKKWMFSYVRNNHLKTIRKGYKGNLIIKGRFINDKRIIISWLNAIKWAISKNPQAKEKKNNLFQLKIIKNSPLSNIKKDAIIWLGHSTFFIRLNGKNIITDPCLFKLPFIKRLIDTSCDSNEITNIDYLLISHSHRDHLDSNSIRNLNLKGTTALLPLRLGETVKSINNDIIVQEAGWFQQYITDKIEIYLLPAQHWSQRGISDINKTLWGSYIIRSKNKTIFFGGDTAFSSHFKDINAHFPKINYCLLPVGAYKPEYVMKNKHMSPREAVKAFHVLGGKTMIPMHFATFDLSDEPPGEPVHILNDLHNQKKILGNLVMLNVREIFYI